MIVYGWGANLVDCIKTILHSRRGLFFELSAFILDWLTVNAPLELVFGDKGIDLIIVFVSIEYSAMVQALVEVDWLTK